VILEKVIFRFSGFAVAETSQLSFKSLHCAVFKNSGGTDVLFVVFLSIESLIHLGLAVDYRFSSVICSQLLKLIYEWCCMMMCWFMGTQQHRVLRIGSVWHRHTHGKTCWSCHAHDAAVRPRSEQSTLA